MKDVGYSLLPHMGISSGMDKKRGDRISLEWGISLVTHFHVKTMIVVVLHNFTYTDTHTHTCRMSLAHTHPRLHTQTD